MNINSGDAKLVLLCPAWKKWGTARTVKPDTVILHSRGDDVIPFADSEELAKRSRANLIEVGTDHRLAEPEPLSVMLWPASCWIGQSLAELNEDESHECRTLDIQNEVGYICDACGEEIVIPVDISEGIHQTYVEDCPVCCRANLIHIDVDEEGNAKVWQSRNRIGNDPFVTRTNRTRAMPTSLSPPSNVQEILK